jgi:glycosyltransferase involved in cell wall biosynthesis
MMLTDILGIGGMERVLVSLSRGLSERGHAITVVAEPGGALWNELPTSVHRLPAPPRRTRLQKFRYFLWLARLVRSGQFDIVHAHQRGVALQARVARTLTRTRVVEHCHTLIFSDYKRWLSFHGDRLIACGDAIAEMLVRDFRRPAHRITTVTNAVPDLGRGELLTLPASRMDRLPTILVVARVTKQKDPHRFIDVISAVNSSDRRVNALWVGDGDLLPECLEEVRRRKVEGLSFVGAHTDVVPFLRESDLLMLTSRWEGLPLVLLEAASMGRGLVAPDVGGCAEAVDHGSNGLLFDVDSTPEAIAAQLAEILDVGTLQLLGDASRRKYLNQFTVQGQVEKVEQVYLDALRP